jgi:flagellar hook-basal body complex protein FliE
MVDVNLSRATNAYQQQLKLVNGMGAGEMDAPDGPSFGDFLGKAIDHVVDSGKKAEKAQLAALTGEGDLSNLVTAVAEAELALNTVVAVRDRVISAYQEILRMPI